MPDFPTIPTSQSSDTFASDDKPSPPHPLNDVPDAVAPIPPKKKRGGRTHVFLVALVVLLLGGGSGLGAFVYVNTRPQPSIHLTSRYVLASIPVGASGTTFQVSGQNFPGQTNITFLLDGTLAPGTTSRQSTSTGQVTSTLRVTAAWAPGKHTISARIVGSAPTKGVTILIVTAGEDNTPGPNGAPSDSARGSIVVTMQPHTSSRQLSLQMQRGTICGSEDDGKLHTFTQNASGDSADAGPGLDTFSATCTGTYREGHVSYTETITSETIQGNYGVSCSAKKPYQMHLEGTFTGPTTLVGTSSTDAFTWHCTITPVPGQQYGVAFDINGKPSSQEDVESSASVGTWTGLVSLH